MRLAALFADTKQLVVKKYLPFYEWVLFADSDVMFNLSKPVEPYLRSDKSLYFNWCNHALSLLDAGVFVVRNTPVSWHFLDEWVSYGYLEKAYANNDNGVLHLLLLERLDGYDGSCHGYFTGEKDYADNRRCVESFLMGDGVR